jgi:hypothetical protein
VTRRGTSRAGIAAAAATGIAVAAGLAHRHRRRRRPDDADRVRILDPEGPPLIDATGGARSVQAAELRVTDAELEALWSPGGLERLARTYWSFLPRISLGLIRVRYTSSARLILLLGRPLVLLSFGPPAYELDDTQGFARWPIHGGLLLSARGRPSRGALQIGIRRRGPAGPGEQTLGVEVSVVDFVPTIAWLFGRGIYAATQSRIHVLVTHAFLRSLARSDLAAPPGGSSPAGAGG